MQLTALLPNASGVRELEDFRCYMSGDAHTRVDLVQSFEVGTLRGHPLPHQSAGLGMEKPFFAQPCPGGLALSIATLHL